MNGLPINSLIPVSVNSKFITLSNKFIKVTFEFSAVLLSTCDLPQQFGLFKTRKSGNFQYFKNQKIAHEKDKIHGTADCLCFKTGRDRHIRDRGGTKVGCFGGHVLQLEEKIWQREGKSTFKIPFYLVVLR